MAIKVNKKDAGAPAEGDDTRLAERRSYTPFNWISEFDSMMNEFRRGLFDWFYSPLDDALMPSLPASRLPAMDIEATDTEYAIHADLPGLAKDDVNITLEGNTLSISAEAKSEDETKDKNYIRKERRYESFYRAVALPEDADLDADLDATLENGVLRVAVKRKAPAPKKEVKIK